MATVPFAPQSLETTEDSELLRGAVKHGLTSERRERARRKALAEIPRWYRPYVHLAATTGTGLVVLVASLVGISRAAFHWTDALVVPAVILFSNFFEWLVHRDVLHKRRWPVEVIYDRHTPVHHMVYSEDDMALQSVKEFRLVLIPAAGVIGIVVAAAPPAIFLAHFWSPAAGWLFLLSASLFMVSYEILHLCYHAPKDSFIGRRKLIAVLRAHHARHHDPTVMQRYNFNVTVPIFDWIMGTMAPKR